jgi:predicted transposase YdaD
MLHSVDSLSRNAPFSRQLRTAVFVFAYLHVVLLTAAQRAVELSDRQVYSIQGTVYRVQYTVYRVSRQFLFPVIQRLRRD